jgi:hypothetical protein
MSADVQGNSTQPSRACRQSIGPRRAIAVAIGVLMSAVPSASTTHARAVPRRQPPVQRLDVGTRLMRDIDAFKERLARQKTYAAKLRVLAALRRYVGGPAKRLPTASAEEYQDLQATLIGIEMMFEKLPVSRPPPTRATCVYIETELRVGIPGDPSDQPLPEAIDALDILAKLCSHATTGRGGPRRMRNPR